MLSPDSKNDRKQTKNHRIIMRRAEEISVKEMAAAGCAAANRPGGAFLVVLI
jgi:hypothetical protein